MTVRALVFTDVVDSTRIGERIGDARAAELWAKHDRRARDLVARHAGREIGRGDGLFLLFDRTADAARYALDYHASLSDLGVTARVGIHAGTVSLRDNAPESIVRGARQTEVDGIAVSLTARIMSLASGGQTLMSAAARHELADEIPERAAVQSHGHFRLKGLEAPVEVFELALLDAPSASPPGDFDKAYRVVREGEVWRPVRDIRHNLPAERDAFVGRTGDLRRLAARLDAGARLLTVHGPGGTGKTRFVRRYGLLWLGDWPGGVYFCDLYDARSLDGVFFAVASALAVPLGKDEPEVQLGHAIAGRGRCLVILDNFEQVVEDATATLGRWLDRAQDAAFVVTSRELLHLPGEEVFTVEPLPVAKEAIELFEARARAHGPGFALNASNRAAIAEVVKLLDGLPLAIELAAARVRVLSPTQMVERMRDRFQLLAGARGPRARQATLRAAIDWSWDLLEPFEQAAFAHCSTFEGGFTLEAAEAVLDLSHWPLAPATMDVVQALADKSLLRSWVPVEHRRYDIEEPHFGMYLSIHEYAAEKLDAGGPEARRNVEIRHGRFFARYGSDEAIERLSARDGARLRHALALELDNLVAAARRACVREDSGIAVDTYRAAWEVLSLQGPLALGVALGAEVRVLAGLSDVQRVSVDATLAQALRRSGRVDEAPLRLNDALALSRAIGDARREATLLVALANYHREQGRSEQARACYESALDVARRVGDRRTEGKARGGLGLLHRERGETERAREHFDAALAIARENGDALEAGTVLGNLGLLSSERGANEEARLHLEAALAAARDVGDRQLQGAVLANLAQLCTEQGRSDEARRDTEAALSIHRDVGNRRLEAIALGNLGALCMNQGRLPEAQAHFERALAIAREVGNRRHEAFLFLSLGMLRHVQGRTQEACDAYEVALTMAREVADRRGEGIVLSRLAQLFVEEGRLDEAQAHYQHALQHARDGGYRRLEGVVLGGIGDLLARQGRATDALHRLHQAEVLLREVLDREELGKLLCMRGRLDAASGSRGEAQAALAEAESIAASMGAPAHTELGREIVRLRAALA